MPESFGSAIENPFETMPQTISLAGMPMRSRYCRRACDGWMSPAQVSLSVRTEMEIQVREKEGAFVAASPLYYAGLPHSFGAPWIERTLSGRLRFARD
jgi:hypothetical protein